MVGMLLQVSNNVCLGAEAILLTQSAYSRLLEASRMSAKDVS